MFMRPKLGIIISLYRCWGTERQGNLSKVTQLWGWNQRFIYQPFGSRAHTGVLSRLRALALDL